jgi:hypothetical protein
VGEAAAAVEAINVLEMERRMAETAGTSPPDDEDAMTAQFERVYDALARASREVLYLPDDLRGRVQTAIELRSSHEDVPKGSDNPNAHYWPPRAMARECANDTRDCVAAYLKNMDLPSNSFERITLEVALEDINRISQEAMSRVLKMAGKERREWITSRPEVVRRLKEAGYKIPEG